MGIVEMIADGRFFVVDFRHADVTLVHHGSLGVAGAAAAAIVGTSSLTNSPPKFLQASLMHVGQMGAKRIKRASEVAALFTLKLIAVEPGRRGLLAGGRQLPGRPLGRILDRTRGLRSFDILPFRSVLGGL